MSRDRAAPQAAPPWRGRMLEWAWLAGVLAVLVLLFIRQVEEVQGQGELAAVRVTLGALRTALVLDHLQQKVKPVTPVVTAAAPNPFELLQRRPLNYWGEARGAEARDAPPGSWVFDPACACVGYMPLYAQWFDSPSGEPMAWYRLNGAPGPLQLTAQEVYRWQSELMN